MDNVQIFEQELKNKAGNVIGKVAVMRGGLGTENPTEILNSAVDK